MTSGTQSLKLKAIPWMYRTAEGSKKMSKCLIVGESQLDVLMRKYLGLGTANLTPDEKELLLFGLYLESKGHGGIGARATAAGDARIAEQKAKLDEINKPKDTGPAGIEDVNHPDYDPTDYFEPPIVRNEVL